MAEAGDEPSGIASSAAERGAGGPGWRVTYRPYPELFRSANDPLHIVRALAELGELEVTADFSALPALEDLEPEECHLAWILRLRGAVEREQVVEAFAWVEDLCVLDVAPLEPEDGVEGADGEPALAPVTSPVSGESAITRKDAHGGESPPAPAAAPKAGPESGGGSIRVSTEKIDKLINLVGELVITQSMLNRFGEAPDSTALEGLQDGLNQLARHTRELQENVMQIRMLPIRTCFNRFPRLVRDLSAKLGKEVELTMAGEQTELDKTVLEKITDPLVHLVRNALDHGIETPEARGAAGKPPTGTLHLEAYHEGGNIIIEVSDDGAGLPRRKLLEKARARGLVGEGEAPTDEQVDNLIFHPGFSTAGQVSDVSGREVGMDVVRRNIHDLGGSVSIHSEEGRGSRLTIRLPLTLAILDGQLVRVGTQTYVVPIVSIVESLQVRPELVRSISGRTELFSLRDAFIPILRLYRICGSAPDSERLEDGLLVVVEAERTPVGLFVDELLGQQQVVIKSLETNFGLVPGVSGATILGDGTVALILDVPGLVSRAVALDGSAPRRLAAVA